MAGQFSGNQRMIPAPSKDVGQQLLIKLSPLAVQLLAELQQEHNCTSRNELLEWLIYCQRFSGPEAEALLRNRRQRGERTAVIPLPPDAILPPEG